MELPELLNAAAERWRSLPLRMPEGSRDAVESEMLARIDDLAEDALAAGVLAGETGDDGAPRWCWAPAYRDEPAPFESQREAA